MSDRADEIAVGFVPENATKIMVDTASGARRVYSADEWREQITAALRAYAEAVRREEREVAAKDAQMRYQDGYASGVEDEREACARIAEAVKGGFTSNIRIHESEQEMVRDPDGPWVLNSDVAAAIRARGEKG